MKNEVKVPDGSEVEKWLDPDTFIWHGKVWKIESSGKIVYLRDLKPAK